MFRRDPASIAKLEEVNLMRGPGEKKAEAFNKPDSLGEFHLSSCTRGFRKCYAKYASKVFAILG
jgi:hypothetical protein